MYNLNTQVIRSVAIQEVLKPSFTLTEQFLAANRIILKDRVPWIEDIILDPKENLARVYFPVEGERYYFVVVLTLEPHTTVRGIVMAPGNDVYFAVRSENRSLEELLTLADIKPTRIWKKGEKNGKLPLHNGFELRLVEKKTGEVEDKLRSLLDALLPYKTSLNRLSQVASAEVYIAYYGYKEQMWGIHLDQEIISDLAALQLPVDIDLYASGPDLEMGK